MSLGYAYNSSRGYQAGDMTYAGGGFVQPRPAVPPSYADLLGRPNVGNVLLLTCGLNEPLGKPQAWTYSVGPCWRWRTALPRVDALTFDGGEIGFTQVFDIELIDAEGFYYFDPAGYVVIAHTGTWQDVYAWERAWEARADLRFANRPKALRGYDWAPRLVRIPGLGVRIESKFSGVGALGGGRIELANADGFFDALDAGIWDRALCILELGLDLPANGGLMAAADYRTVGTWRVESTEKAPTSFGLNVRELKTRLDDDIPTEVTTWTDYPNMPEDMRHKVIPRAYGRIFGATAICIDSVARRFKVAGHAVRSFDGVRIRTDNAWHEAAFASTNRTLGEFTLDADWEVGRDVSVDFRGRVNSDGGLMVNGADIVADLLDYLGETELDQDSFERSRALLRVGYDRFGNEICELEPSLYLAEEESALDILSQLNETLNAALFADLAGRWRFIVFDPRRRSDLATQPGLVAYHFTDLDLLMDTFKATVDVRELFANVRVNFAPRIAEDWTGRIKLDAPELRTAHGLPRIASNIRTPLLSDEAQAQRWGQRLLRMEAEPRRLYAFNLARPGYFLAPGDKIHLALARYGLDHVLEVLDVKQDLTGNSAAIICGDLRSWQDTFGFWVEDAKPNWSDAWTDAEARAARQNSGFWCEKDGTNETDMADKDDPRSYRPSRWL